MTLNDKLQIMRKYYEVLEKYIFAVRYARNNIIPTDLGVFLRMM